MISVPDVAMRSVVVFAVLTITPSVLRPAELAIRLDAREVASKRVHTDLTLTVRPGPLTLSFPKWLPAENAPSGPLESIIGMQITAKGVGVPWKRDALDMYAVHLVVPAGVDHLHIALDSGLATGGAGFTSGPTSSAQLAILNWNQFVLMPKGRDAAHLDVVATLLPPSGWQVASALDVKAIGAGTYELEPASLERLVDSPVQLGRYALNIKLGASKTCPMLSHDMSIMADSPESLKLPEGLVADYSRMLNEYGALFGSCMYRHYTWLLSLSDHVAHFGMEHHESSDDRSPERSLSAPDMRWGVAAVVSHEYAHSCIGKYRRPRGLLSPDYARPMDSSLLWVYEGLTEFWGNVLTARANLTSAEDYREILAAAAGDFDVAAGPKWRPLADTAIAAQTLSGAPAAWASSRRGTDFYRASAFLWLDVDAELRTRTAGKASLDDFMRAFCKGASGAPAVKVFDEQDIYTLLGTLAPADWVTLIRKHLDTTGTAALKHALERSGWRLVYSAEPNTWMEFWGKRRNKRIERSWSIGLRLSESGTILDVMEAGAAAQAGASPGMVLVAVNGRKFTAEAIDAAMEAARAKRTPINLLVSSNDFYSTLTVNYFDGLRYPHLQRIDATSDLLTPLLAGTSERGTTSHLP